VVTNDACAGEKSTHRCPERDEKIPGRRGVDRTLVVEKSSARLPKGTWISKPASSARHLRVQCQTGRWGVALKSCPYRLTGRRPSRLPTINGNGVGHPWRARRRRDSSLPPRRHRRPECSQPAISCNDRRQYQFCRLLFCSSTRFGRHASIELYLFITWRGPSGKTWAYRHAIARRLVCHLAVMAGCSITVTQVDDKHALWRPRPTARCAG